MVHFKAKSSALTFASQTDISYENRDYEAIVAEQWINTFFNEFFFCIHNIMVYVDFEHKREWNAHMFIELWLKI